MDKETYRKALRQKYFKNQVLNAYSKLPEKAKNMTMEDARKKWARKYRKFAYHVNEMVDKDYLDFNKNSTLEEVINLLNRFY